MARWGCGWVGRSDSALAGVVKRVLTRWIFQAGKNGSEWGELQEERLTMLRRKAEVNMVVYYQGCNVMIYIT
jgi:hypothetical protein